MLTENRSKRSVDSLRYAISQCRLGGMLVAASDAGVCAILLGDDPAALVADLVRRFPEANPRRDDEGAARWVALARRYIDSPARDVDLPLDLRGTPFQLEVWHALCAIPPGATASYSEIARRIGRPTAVRAVASAIAANPIAVAVPCHRAIRSDGSLSGYHWGVDRKRQLLVDEDAWKCDAPERAPASSPRTRQHVGH